MVSEAAKKQKTPKKIIELGDLLPMLLLGALIFVFCSLWCFTTLPSSEAWHIYYVELVKHGLFPYKDFYYYLPPLPLLMDCLTWPLCGGLLFWYKVIRIIERLLIYEFLYLFIRRETRNRWVAWFACTVGSVMFAGSVYDLGGDYNQTSYFLIVVVEYFVICFIENWGQEKYLYFSGGALGVLFLIKQNSFLASGIVNLGMLIFLCAQKSDNKIWKYLLEISLGMLFPLGVAFVILAANGALIPYIDQTLLVSGKGSVWLIVFGWAKTLAKEKCGLVAAAIPLLSVGIKGILQDSQTGDAEDRDSELRRNAVEIGSLLVGLGSIYLFYKDLLGGLLSKAFVNPIVLTLTALFALVACGCAKAYDSERKRWPYNVLICVLMLALIGIIVACGRNVAGSAESLFNVDNPSGLMLTLTYAIMAFLMYQMLWWSARVTKAKESNRQGDTGRLIFVATGFISMLASSMGGGSSPVPLGFFAGAPIAIVCLIESPTCCKMAKDALVYAFAGLVVFSVCSQKATSSYSWWGWWEAPTWEERGECSVDGLEGFRLTDDEKELYEQIYKVIKTDAPENPIILGFPHIVIFNWLSGTDQLGRFVPVLFYDVCSEKYAKQDAVILAQNEPDVVIWEDIPYCFSVHESVFNRGERLGQRDIQDWFADVKDSDYELMYQHGSFYVYVKKLSLVGDYRHIDDPARINETAISGSN